MVKASFHSNNPFATAQELPDLGYVAKTPGGKAIKAVQTLNLIGSAMGISGKVEPGELFSQAPAVIHGNTDSHSTDSIGRPKTGIASWWQGVLARGRARRKARYIARHNWAQARKRKLHIR